LHLFDALNHSTCNLESLFFFVLFLDQFLFRKIHFTRAFPLNFTFQTSTPFECSNGGSSKKHTISTSNVKYKPKLNTIKSVHHDASLPVTVDRVVLPESRECVTSRRRKWTKSNRIECEIRTTALAGSSQDENSERPFEVGAKEHVEL
jgi:hypothetical protein